MSKSYHINFLSSSPFTKLRSSCSSISEMVIVLSSSAYMVEWPAEGMRLMNFSPYNMELSEAPISLQRLEGVSNAELVALVSTS